MYLQITTRCNMKCSHCCYSCRPGKGKHMDYHTAIDAIAFARNYTETISIGGGEPTLHPRFFDILRFCLQDFDYVWMATNGSQTKAMWRLHNIIENCDYESFEREDYCTCGEEDCYCEPEGLIAQDGKLYVALSLDHFHDRDKVDERIEQLWERMSARQNSHYEIRDVTRSRNGVADQGRAKRTGAGWGDHCVCSDHIVRPDGKIKMCGCTGAPVIGNIWSGIEDKWRLYMDEEHDSPEMNFNYTNCYIATQKRRKEP